MQAEPGKIFPFAAIMARVAQNAVENSMNHQAKLLAAPSFVNNGFDWSRPPPCSYWPIFPFGQSTYLRDDFKVDKDSRVVVDPLKLQLLCRNTLVLAYLEYCCVTCRPFSVRSNQQISKTNPNIGNAKYKQKSRRE